jgi:predicted phage terminase large subunit-like protein
LLEQRVRRLEDMMRELRQNRQQQSKRRLSFRPGNLLRHLEAAAEDIEEIQRKAQARGDYRLAMADRLEAVATGKRRKLMTFMPPRHGKSFSSTQIFPAWYLGHYPERSIITITYGQELADEFGRKVQRFVASPVHQQIFPACRIANDATSMRHFSTTAGGSYYAVGRGGPMTGRGADLIIFDDPLKDREEAQSEIIRRALHDCYAFVAYTRLQPAGAIVIVQTRWHEDDLAGRLLREQADLWDVLSQAAIAETNESFRDAGEALWPERFPLSELQQIRASIGEAAWASLYQQRPAAAEGSIFKREWWRTYREYPKLTRVVQSWDTAFKTGNENDFSVCTTWGVAESGFYLLAMWRGRVEFPDLKKQVISQAQEWKPSKVLVEDRASGQSLIQEMKYKTWVPITPVKVDTDKSARAQAITPVIEAGRVFLPELATWRNDYIDEFAAFPTGAHDDLVDSTTQALNYLRHQPVHTVWMTRVNL